MKCNLTLLEVMKYPRAQLRRGVAQGIKCSLEVFIRRHQGREASPDEPQARTKCGLVEVPGVEPGSEDCPHNGSTCATDRFRFTATAQATEPVKEMLC